MVTTEYICLAEEYPLSLVERYCQKLPTLVFQNLVLGDYFYKECSPQSLQEVTGPYKL